MVPEFSSCTPPAYCDTARHVTTWPVMIIHLNLNAINPLPHSHDAMKIIACGHQTLPLWHWGCSYSLWYHFPHCFNPKPAENPVPCCIGLPQPCWVYANNFTWFWCQGYIRLCPHRVRFWTRFDKIDFAKVAFASTTCRLDAESILESNLKVVHQHLNRTRIELTSVICCGATWSPHGFAWPVTLLLVAHLCACVGQAESFLGWFLCPHCIAS